MLLGAKSLRDIGYERILTWCSPFVLSINLTAILKRKKASPRQEVSAVTWCLQALPYAVHTAAKCLFSCFKPAASPLPGSTQLVQK